MHIDPVVVRMRLAVGEHNDQQRRKDADARGSCRHDPGIGYRPHDGVAHRDSARPAQGPDAIISLHCAAGPQTRLWDIADHVKHIDDAGRNISS